MKHYALFLVSLLGLGGWSSACADQTDGTTAEVVQLLSKNDPSELSDGQADAATIRRLLRDRRQHIAQQIQQVNATNQEKKRQVLEKEAKEKEAKEKEAKEKEIKEKEAKEKEIKEKEDETASHFDLPPSTALEFLPSGLLRMQASLQAQQVVNGLLAIPGHQNGQWYHQQGLDQLIAQLSAPEAVWVVHRIEGPGFGQTSAGYAGSDTPASHQAFVNQQVNRRYDGSIHQLLRKWGTYSYGGY